ncbi:MAG: hypothetical protein Q9178_001390 [Gyalolechia marmorata]
MGIPRFVGHLQQYSVNATIGHKSTQSDGKSDRDNAYPTKVVIDGPGLAYHIYYRLGHISNPLSVVEAIPSYGQIGQAVIAFLSELEAYHVQMFGDSSPSHIYFDGYLPLHKRHVRLSRLESYLKDLVKVQNKYPNGLGVAESAPQPLPLLSSHLFNSFHSVHGSLRGLPTLPFLVPAVLDALSTTRYASITDIVPGEADTYCAKAVKDHGGMILTSDSDMLVYDIGDNNAVIFFSGLEIQEDPNAATGVISLLRAKIYPTAQIANRLGLPNLQQLAYHCNVDPTLSFAEARKRVLQPVQDEALWRRFQEEYSMTLEPDNVIRPQSSKRQLQGFLDPRLSEFILQLSTPARQDETNIYLPFLMDDPSRASAWYVSSFIRQTLYEILVSQIPPLHTPLPLPVIMEISRRGFRIFPSVVPLSTSTAPVAQRVAADNIHTLISRWQMGTTSFQTVSPMFRYRIFALSETYRWHIDNLKNPPSRNSIARTMTGFMGSLVEWEDIHLHAQVEAVLYALRMIKQGLGYISAAGKAGVEGQMELENILEDLPPLSGLLPSSMELRGFAEKEKIDIAQVVSYVTEVPGS